MELRHRDLETGSGSQLREREAAGEQEGKEKELGSIGIHMRIAAEVRRKI